MAKSECKCHQFSCESLLDKTESGYIKATNRRFRFEKEEGVIVNGGIVDNDIDHCEIRIRRKLEDSQDFVKEKDGCSHQNGHRERTLYHDQRKHGHSKHWKEESKRYF